MRTSHLTLDQTICWGEGKRKKKEKEREEEGRRKDFRERRSTFSLDFPAIRPSVLVGARDKVDPRSKSYEWVPESGSFKKLQEVGIALLLSLFLV